MLLGTGNAVITPPLGTYLSGYGFRDHGAESVLDELELRVFWFQEAAGDHAPAACILTADLIGFDAELTTSIRAELAETCGIAPEAALLAASHTHSGPQTCVHLAAAGGMPDPSYLEAFRARLREAVAAARATLRPVTLHCGRGWLEGYAIHRRRCIGGTITMAPNPEGIRDDEVTVVVARDAETAALRAVLFHYTCHPTTMGDYRITGDYPGVARRHIERALHGVAAGFLPGCFGDIRPFCAVMGGQQFRRGTPEDIAAFGGALGAEVVRVARAAGPARPARLFAKASTLALPLQQEPETAPLSLQRLDLAEGVSLIALGGEMCVDYGLFVKSLGGLPVGYANGLVGYVCPARYLDEGGYEPIGSCVYFGLPSPFQPVVEAEIKAALQALLR
jgi:hypothetical protein